MPTLICYDISNNSLRTKMGRKILEYGLDRINKSVYLGAPSETGLKDLESLLQKLVQTKGEPQDSLIVLPVRAEQIQRMRIYGRNDLDPQELSGEKSTLLIQLPED